MYIINYNFNTELSERELNEFLYSQKVLLNHVNNKDNYRTNQYKIFSGLIISKSYESQNQRRSYFIECNFKNTSFKNSGFTGSYFINCNFYNCKFDFAIFDNCYFDNCHFENSILRKILSSSFCGSIFKGVTFSLCDFDACSLTSINCYNTKFNKCTINNIIWENSKIHNCVFDNVIIQNTNIEYVYFYDNTLINTSIPFASIPFAFKCLDYIFETIDDIRIGSKVSENGISKEEYIALIPDLITFYKYTNNFFPLANLYASTGKMNHSFEVIKKSVSFLVKLHEYRTLKYISVLMTIYDFSIVQKNEIYKLIKSELYIQSLSNEDKLLNADVYLFEIRNNLLNDTTKGYVTFEFYTNIESNDTTKLSFFIEKIEHILNVYNNKITHYIEYRHNSPYQFLLSIFSSPEKIAEIIGILHFSLLGIDKFINKFLDIKQKRLNNKKTKEEIQKYHNENAERDTCNFTKFTNNDCIKMHEDMEQQSIKVNLLYHNVYNIDISNYGENFQHYFHR